MKGGSTTNLISGPANPPRHASRWSAHRPEGRTAIKSVCMMRPAVSGYSRLARGTRSKEEAGMMSAWSRLSRSSMTDRPVRVELLQRLGDRLVRHLFEHLVAHAFIELGERRSVEFAAKRGERLALVGAQKLMRDRRGLPRAAEALAAHLRRRRLRARLQWRAGTQGEAPSSSRNVISSPRPASRASDRTV